MLSNVLGDTMKTKSWPLFFRKLIVFLVGPGLKDKEKCNYIHSFTCIIIGFMLFLSFFFNLKTWDWKTDRGCLTGVYHFMLSKSFARMYVEGSHDQSFFSICHFRYFFLLLFWCCCHIFLPLIFWLMIKINSIRGFIDWNPERKDVFHGNEVKTQE